LNIPCNLLYILEHKVKRKTRKKKFKLYRKETNKRRKNEQSHCVLDKAIQADLVRSVCKKFNTPKIMMICETNTSESNDQCYFGQCANLNKKAVKFLLSL
jgi:hypothetical protein